MEVCMLSTLWTVACQAPLSILFPGKNTRVGCHFLLQGIYPTQGSNPCLSHLLHWQLDSLPLHHLGSPPIRLEWTKRRKGGREEQQKGGRERDLHLPFVQGLVYQSLGLMLYTPQLLILQPFWDGGSPPSILQMRKTEVQTGKTT